MKRKLNKAAKKNKAGHWKVFAWVFVLSLASSEFNDFRETISAEDCIQEKVEIVWDKRSVIIPVKCKADYNLKTAITKKDRNINYKL